MSLGNAVSKNDVDNKSAQLALTLRTNFDGIRHFKVWLDTKVDGDLVTLGYTQGEVNILRSATGDMDELRRIYEGLATLANAKDFRQFTKLLTGVS